MINYKELYNNLENPLTHEVMVKIIEEYITTGYIDNYLKYYYTSELNKGSYYDDLSEEEKNEMNNNHKTYINKLYSMVFNVWKNNIGNLTDEQIQQMIDAGLVGNDYYEVRDYLKNTSYIDSARKFHEIINGNQACEKYSRGFFVNNNWEHFYSDYLTYPFQRINVEHRLYLNPLNSDCYEMAYLFAEKCISRNIPFYFKMDNSVADDKIVIYSDTEHLKEYISVLNEIKKAHPYLASKAQKPPVLCGLIDGWIGYGSEPEQKRESFNSKRRKLIEMVLDQSIGALKGKYSGQQIKVNDESAEQMRQNILALGGRLGIDSNNFCIDNNARDKLFNYEDEIRPIENAPTLKYGTKK